jgi:hypothetical protein
MDSSERISRVCSSILGTLPPRTEVTVYLTTVICSHDLVDEHLREHGLEGIVLLAVQRLGQQNYGVVELLAVEGRLIVFPTGLLESLVEHIDSEAVGDHVAFDAQQEELSDVHVALELV